MRSFSWLVVLAACGAPSTQVQEPVAPTEDEAPGPAEAAECDEPFARKDAEDPPFGGTAFIDADVIGDDDASSFAGLTYKGQEQRTIFDRRASGDVTVDAYVFVAQLGATKQLDVQVNPELGRERAEQAALTYATALGRLPAFLLRDLPALSIHGGKQKFAGGPRGIVLHTEQAEDHMRKGVVEETFLHEASHAVFDRHHAKTARWQEAQEADGTFISRYASDNPGTEDVAESLVPYLAVRHRADRLEAGVREQIEAAIPARIRYFDCVGLAMTPLE